MQVWFYFYHSLHMNGHKSKIKMKINFHECSIFFAVHNFMHMYFTANKNVIQRGCITFILNVIRGHTGLYRILQ